MPTKLWGSVRYNRQQGAFCVYGRYQGQQLYYSGYNTLKKHYADSATAVMGRIVDNVRGV